MAPPPPPGTPSQAARPSTAAAATGVGRLARVARVERVTRRTRATSVKIVRSFYYAFAGLSYLFRTQRNARIHLVVGAAACGLAAWAGISRAEWAVLIFTIALVLILEGLNTAVEAAIDLASPRIHPLAKAAKDVAAGMVLIAAMASVAVGLLILGPPLWRKVLGE